MPVGAISTDDVSIRAPVRERIELCDIMADMVSVSIRAPVRERMGSRCRRAGVTCGFNPRSRAGANAIQIEGVCDGQVSIRAPVRERIPEHVAGGQALVVSIRAPVRERIAQACADTLPFQVSIRAPVRERMSAPLVAVRLNRFQSALPCGSE